MGEVLLAVEEVLVAVEKMLVFVALQFSAAVVVEFPAFLVLEEVPVVVEQSHLGTPAAHHLIDEVKSGWVVS